MKNNRAILRTLAALALAAFVMAAGMFGLQQSLARAEQLPPSSADGTTIESIELKWVTRDSVYDNNGQPLSEELLGDENHLFISTDSKNNLSMIYQFEVAFSGQHDYEPGDIEIIVPAQVWHGRNLVDDGNGGQMGVVDETSWIGSMHFSVPMASGKADFHWYLDGNNYVLTNSKVINATSKAMFQLAITHVDPEFVPDMSQSEPISVLCRVVTHEGNQIQLLSHQLTAQLDTCAKLTGANKSSFREIYEIVPNELPKELLQRLPEGADPDDYLYVRWTSDATITGNQPYSLSFRDTLSDAYVMENGEKKFVTEGIFLGADSPVLSSQYPTDGSCHFAAEMERNSISLWSAYQKEDFYIPYVDEDQIQYIFDNHAEWELLERDAQVGSDGREHSQSEADGSTSYVPVRWSRPEGHYNVDKYIISRPQKQQTISYALNRLYEGKDITIPFELRSTMFGYHWTSDPSVADPDEDDMGKLGWRAVVTDDRTTLAAVDTELTADDFAMASLRVRKPARFRYAKAEQIDDGYYDDGDDIVSGMIPAGSWGFLGDDSLPVPDLHVQYQVNGAGEWIDAATAVWGEDGKGEMQLINVGGDVTVSSNTISFPANTTDVRTIYTSNVFNGQKAETCEIAAIIWNVDLDIVLKASDRVRDIAGQLFASGENPSLLFRNDVHLDMTIHETEQDPDGITLTDLDMARAFLTGTSYGVKMSKSCSYGGLYSADNDVENKQAILHYSATVEQKSNIAGIEDYRDACEKGLIPVETSGVWYDLLPPGVTPLMDTIKVSDGTIQSSTLTPNFRNTGRTLLMVEYGGRELEPIWTSDGYSECIRLTFDAVYAWEDMMLLGDRLTNYIAYRSRNSQLTGGVWGSRKNEIGEPDDPRGGNNAHTPVMPDEIADAFTNLDDSSDESRFLYAKDERTVTALMSALTSLSKTAATREQGVYVQGLDGQAQIAVREGRQYSYRLRVRSSEESVTNEIVLYDSIENYDIPADDVSKQADWQDREAKKAFPGEWQGKGQWHGTLLSVDASEFVNAGAVPVLYYTSDASAVESMDRKQADFTGWTAVPSTQISAAGVWEVPQDLRASVKCIAIDLRQPAASENMPEGETFTLYANEYASVYLHMVAPDDHGSDDVWLAKGAYARKADAPNEVDWDLAMNPANNMYAYNNAYLRCKIADEDAMSTGVINVIRNDYTRVGLLPNTVKVTKVWKDQNNHDNIRPSELTVTLLHRVAGSSGDFEPVLDGSGNPRTVVLNDQNNWTGFYHQVDATTQNGDAYVFSFDEGDVPGYTLNVIKLGEGVYELENSHPNDQVAIHGQKLWDDENNRYHVRPQTVTVRLLRDGERIDALTIGSDDRGEWHYSFVGLDKYAYGGTEYVYTVEETYVPKYVSTVEGTQFITNRYCPFGDLAVYKQLANATDAAARKSFTFTLRFFEEQTGLEAPDAQPRQLADGYAYIIYAADGSEKSTGTVYSDSKLSLMGGERLVVKNLPSESTFTVTEAETAGFTADEAEQSGMIKAGEETALTFVNTYQAQGSVRIPFAKTIQGQSLRHSQFSFELLDDQGNQLYVVKNGAPTNEQDQLGQPIEGEAAGAFLPLNYTTADDGCTYTYTVREVRENPIGGTTYDETEYEIAVTVADNGDGTLTVTAIRTDTNEDVTVSGSAPVFANRYEATGKVQLKAWKKLLRRDLQADEFTFALYQVNPATGELGSLIGTAANDAEGNVLFPEITFDQDDVSKDPNTPAVYSYAAVELPGTDDTVIYSQQMFVFNVVVKDNRDGTLSFSDSAYEAIRTWKPCEACDGGSEAAPVECQTCGGLGKVQDTFTLPATQTMPVFINDLHSGALQVHKKVVDPYNGNPDQLFNFKVQFLGEDIGELNYTLEDPNAADDNTGAVSPKPANPQPVKTAKQFHATPEQLKGQAYAVLEDGVLTFFRSEDGTDFEGRAFEIPEGEDTLEMENGLVYFFVDEDFDVEWSFDDKGGHSSDEAENYWPWKDWNSQIQKVKMEGAIRPKLGMAFFQNMSQAVEMDLSQLDTSLMTNTVCMFNVCSSLTTLDLSGFDTSNVNNMAFMFGGCRKIQAFDLTSFDTSSAVDMTGMFEGCNKAERIDVSTFNTSNVCNMDHLFALCWKLKTLDLSSFDTSNVVHMNSMFEECGALEEVNLSTFNTSNVKRMDNMFSYCTALKELDLRHFNVQKVTSMAMMFGETGLRKLNLSGWNAASAANMSSMFANCGDLQELNMSGFTTQCPNIYSMFQNCSSLTRLDLSGFTRHPDVDTETVTYSLDNMFSNCTSLLELDISGIDNRKVNRYSPDNTDMFAGVENLAKVKLSDYFRPSQLIEGETVYSFPCPEDAIWMYEADKTKQLRADELFMPGHPGTWVREIPGYTLHLNAGEGGGMMDDQVVPESVPYTFKPTFYRMDHLMTGMRDQNGNFYPLQSGSIHIPKDTYQNDEEITLTAEWEKVNQTVTSTDNIFSFTLAANRTATFSNLPAGTAYMVWEETPDGWILVDVSGESGEIAAGETAYAQFTNEASYDVAQAQLRALKLLDETGAKQGQFAFELVDENGTVLQTVTNAAGGAVVFDPLMFEEAGTFVYRIREVVPAGSDEAEQQQIIYDTAVYTATVTVTLDEENWKFSTALAYSDANGSAVSNLPVFRNRTTPGSLTIRKIAENAYQAALDKQFSFTVRFTQANGSAWNGDNNQVTFADGTKAQVVNGAVSVSLKPGETASIVNLPAGLGYEVAETGSLPGWEMDTQVRTGVIKSDETAELTFTNRYSAQGSAVLEAVKQLNGRAPADGEFTFELLDAEENLLQTVTNTGTKVTFRSLQYTKPSVDIYFIREVKGSDPNIVYSNETIRAVVTVTDVQGEGRLETSVVYRGDDNTITNDTVSGSLTVTKTVVSPVDAHMQKPFTFTLTAAFDGTALNGSYATKDGGTVTFTDGKAVFTLCHGQSITVTGLPVGTSYTVAENAETGFTVTSSGASGVISGTNTAAFTNTYGANGTYVFTAHKTLEGDTLTAGRFTFELVDETGAVVATAANAADGSVTFPAMTFDEQDAGECTFTVREVDAGEVGVSYDTTVYTAVLNVTDNGDGTLTITEKAENEERSFINRFSKKTTISATKQWKGDEGSEQLRHDVVFDLLRSAPGVPAQSMGQKTISAGATGDALIVTWTDLNLMDENGAVYDYTVQEIMPDGSPYQSTVTGSAEEGFVVVNSLPPFAEVQLTARKILEGGTLEAEQFMFELRDAQGNLLSQDRNDADGLVEFPVIRYTQAALQGVQPSENGALVKIFRYTISEQAGTNPAYQYDATVYDVTVTVTLNASGRMTAVAEGDAQMQFINTIANTSFRVTKVWEGNGGGPIELTLYANGEKMDPQPWYDRNGDVYTYNDLPKYDSLGREIVYTAKEKYVAGFTTIYMNPSPYEDKSREVYNNGTIINREKKDPSFTVTKVWENISGKKPDITLVLYCNGVRLDVPTPKPDGNGRYHYYDLPATFNGEPAVYYVVEEGLPGFDTRYENADGVTHDRAYNGGRIINTKLPTTGDSSRPALWLGSMLVSLLLAAGLLLRRKKA